MAAFATPGGAAVETFPRAWLAVIRRNAPFYTRLSAADRAGLLRRVRTFLAEKEFEGCGGLRLSAEIRVTVAAQACRLILHQDMECYPRLRSILVYPGDYRVRDRWRAGDGIVSEEARGLSGLASPRGVVVVSWDTARSELSGRSSGRNLLIHEFAHQLAFETGSRDGIPLLRDPSLDAAFRRILRGAHARHVQDVARGRTTVLRAYGAENQAEFFAVLTEAFFTRPADLKRRHPRLYGQMRALYGQDPAVIG